MKLSQYGGYRTKLWNKRAIFTENTKFLQEIFVIKICGHKTINNTLDRLMQTAGFFFLNFFKQTKMCHKVDISNR